MLEFLGLLKISFVVDPYIVRGLDYYTRTVFEVTHKELGAQNAIGAGGRYDDLISDMDGPSIGACGFALGVDRMVMVLSKEKKEVSQKRATQVFIATLGEQAYKKGFSLMNELRMEGIVCGTHYDDSSLKSQMRAADNLGAKLVVILGDDEIAKEEAIIRNMDTKEQKNVKFSEFLDTLKGMLC